MTGVTLTLDDKQSIGSVRVMVALNDLSLSEAMNALQSLCSYQKAECVWEKNLVNGKEVYFFRQSQGAAKYANRLRQDMQNAIERQAHALIESLKLPVGEIEKLRDSDPETFAIMSDPRCRKKVLAFTDALPASRRLAVIRGEEDVTLKLSELPESCRIYVHEETELFRKNNPTMIIPEPTNIYLNANRIQSEITPAVWFGMGTQESGQGFPIVGSVRFENQWRARIGDDWLAKEEKKTNPLEGETAELREVKEDAKEEDDPALSEWLSRLRGAGTSFSVLARIAEDRKIGLNSQGLAGLTLSEALQRFADYGMAHKWRNDVLMLTNHNWIWTDAEDQLPPFSVIPVLRRQRQANPKGLFSAQEIAESVRLLTKEQIGALAEEFPLMENVAQWHPILSMLGRDAVVRTRMAQGKPLYLSNPAVRKAVFLSPGIGGDQPWSREEENAYQLIVKQTDGVTAKDAAGKRRHQRDISFLIYTKSHKFCAGQGFMQFGGEIADADDATGGVK